MKNLSPKPKGSLLIWTVLLGILMTTAFFFLAQRLNLNASVQSKIAQEQAAELFLNSYADYLQNLPFEDLILQAGEINYEGIVGNLSNSIPQIKGGLDSNQSISYTVAEGKAKVEWGLCANNEAGLALTVEPVNKVEETNCSTTYSQFAETQPSTTFTLTAGDIPVSYRITPLDQAHLYGPEWKLSLELKMDSNKTISLERQFKPLQP